MFSLFIENILAIAFSSKASQPRPQIDSVG